MAGAGNVPLPCDKAPSVEFFTVFLDFFCDYF